MFSRPEPPPAAQPIRRAARWAPALLIAAAVAGMMASPAEVDARGGGEPAIEVDLPGPAPRIRPPGTDVAGANAACGKCHTEIAAEWSGSMHRQAWIDPVFKEAYDIEPLAFCRGCHAPESNPEVAPTAAAQEVGVACTTCHLQASAPDASTSVIVSAHGASPGSPHAVFADARMGTKEACGSCHQFDFPRLDGAPMQDTLEEHASSKFAATPCQTCHMAEKTGPGGRTWKSHAFSVISDPAMIRSAATVTARRAGPRTLAVAIEPRGAGHAFPTGDMFRRLEVRAVAVDPASGRVIAQADPVHLGRTFGDRLAGNHSFAMDRVELEDSRLPAPGAGPGRTIELRFPVAVRGAEVRWQVAYQRMSSAMAASFGVDQARDEVIVDQGELSPMKEAGR